MGKEPQPTGDVAPSEQPSAAREGEGDRPQEHCLREQVEQWVESDPSLVPDRPSALLVEPSVLDPAEVQALLADLGALLSGAEPAPRPAVPIAAARFLFCATGFGTDGIDTCPGDRPGQFCEEPHYEPHA